MRKTLKNHTSPVLIASKGSKITSTVLQTTPAENKKSGTNTLIFTNNISKYAVR